LHVTWDRLKEQQWRIWERLEQRSKYEEEKAASPINTNMARKLEVIEKTNEE